MKKIYFIILSIVFAFSASAKGAHSQEPREGSVQWWKNRSDAEYAKYKNVKRDVVYKTVNGQDLYLDIALPDEEIFKDGAPLIIYYHGGGWTGGTRYSVHPNILKHYLSKGIAFAAVDYRLADAQNVDTIEDITENNNRLVELADIQKGVTIEDAITDCFDATRFLVKNAKEFKINPNALGATGHSAGGHIVLLITMAPSDTFIEDKSNASTKFKFRCGLDTSGPTSFIHKETFDKKTAYCANKNNMIKCFGAPLDEVQDLARKLSPIIYLSKDIPQILVMQGEADSVVPQEGARLLQKMAKEKGLEGKFIFVFVPEGDHNLSSDVEGFRHHNLEKMRFDFMTENLLKGLERK